LVGNLNSCFEVIAMTTTVGARIRAFLVRFLAVVAVVLTYAMGSVGTQVLGVAGISAVGLATTATPAQARRYRRRYYRRRHHRRRWWWW
jgi:hypothetical protein